MNDQSARIAALIQEASACDARPTGLNHALAVPPQDGNPDRWTDPTGGLLT
jgi:hypothetical protein